MANHKSWDSIKTEIEQLREDRDYQSFQPILNWLEPSVNAAEGIDDQNAKQVAVELLTIIQRLHEQKKQGFDVKTNVNEMMGGMFQPEWNVAGDVQQANRDLVINQIQLVFQRFGLELDLAQPSPEILVPIVLVVMTSSEAEALIKGEAFDNAPDELAGQFDQLRRHLDRECADWRERYGAEPKHWKPFGAGPDESTIERLVINALENVNQMGTYPRRLAPEFKDIRTLKDDPLDLRQMREKSCIVIIDIISMRHPALQRAFYYTLLDAYRNTSVVSIAPTVQAYKKAEELIVIIQLKLTEMEFSRRQSDVTEEYAASETINEPPKLAQWISDRVQKMDLSSPDERRGAPRLSDV